MKGKDLFIVAGAIVAALLLSWGQLQSQTVTAGAWGLSFQGEGQTPEGPASAESLKTLDAVYVGDTTQKVLYLTFDAGYENGCTAEILQTLKAHQVPAAFFLVGNYLEQNGDLVRQMVADGHIVANHTMHHKNMSQISQKEAFARELQDLEQLFLEVTGKEMPKYYRPPQGIYSKENLQMAQEMGYKTVFWSLAYADWDNNKQPTAAYALGKLLPRTHPGAIILLHSTSKTNAALLDQLLTTWKDQGYTFRSIDTLFDEAQ